MKKHTPAEAKAVEDALNVLSGLPFQYVAGGVTVMFTNGFIQVCDEVAETQVIISVLPVDCTVHHLTEVERHYRYD